MKQAFVLAIVLGSASRIANTAHCTEGSAKAEGENYPSHMNLQVSQSSAPDAGAVNPKKGLGIVKAQAFLHADQQLHLAWYYDWGLAPQSSVQSRVEFVPMVWGWYGDKSGKVARTLAELRSKLHAKYLLGFNEPDNATQSNLPVDKALKAWPALMAANLPLGAPAAVHADDDWMKQFMSGAKADHYPVSFVPIHWYGMPNPQSFLAYVRHVHELYGKPVWITEFANVDWSTPNKVSKKFTSHDVVHFLRVVLPALNHMKYVMRYAWFSSFDNAFRSSSLFHRDGTLTEAGKVYASE